MQACLATHACLDLILLNLILHRAAVGCSLQALEAEINKQLLITLQKNIILKLWHNHVKLFVLKSTVII